MSTALTRQDFRDGLAHEVVIDDYGFTGEGFARLADGWLSVRGALAGERVRVRLEPGQREGARRIFAELLEVIEPSAMRRDPMCEHAAYCRGCHLRHMSMELEASWKARSIREVLERYAGVVPGDLPRSETIAPPSMERADAWRVRTHLGYRRTATGFQLGLTRPGEAALVPMRHCPALTSPVQRVIGALEQALQALPELPEAWVSGRDGSDDAEEGGPEGGAEAPEQGGMPAMVALSHVRVAAPNHGHGYVELVLGGPPEMLEAMGANDVLETPWCKGLLAELQPRLPEQVGLAVAWGKARHHVRAQRHIRLSYGDVRLEAGLDDWIHATTEPARSLYAHLLEILELEATDALVDVGCGIGTISCLAAPHVREAVGLDIHMPSVESARRNAERLGLGHVRFVAGGWESGLRRLAANRERFTVATVNPMREPLGARALAYLELLGVERLVYLGPSPVAAARDIGELRRMGWELDHAAGANLHPATYHVMLVARLRRPKA